MKTAFITGATAGIGEAAARKFVADGWRVIGTGRRADRLDAPGARAWRRFRALELDMRDTGDVRRGCAADVGPIDLLVNNAGLAPPMSSLQDADQDPIDTVIDDQYRRPRRADPRACCPA